MKLKQMTIWYGKSGLASLGVYYGIMFVLYGVFAVTLLSGRQDIQTNGLGMALAILLFVQGIVCFGQNLRFGMANGVSRRSVFFSYLLFLLPVAVLTAVFNELLLLLVSLASHDMADILYFLYDEYIRQTGCIGGHLAVMLATVCVSLLCGMLGYLLGGAFYRLGKVGRYVMAIGLPVGLFGALPLVMTLLPENTLLALARALEASLNFLAASPLRLAMTAFVGAALFSLFSWLLIRRAPLKTA